MTAAKEEYKKLKATEQLRVELLKAFVKNAALRAKKMRLEVELSRIAERLKANDAVQDVLSRKEFEGLEIAKSPEFLSEIENDAVSAHRRRKQKTGAGGAGARRKSSNSDRKTMLIEIVRAHQGEEFLVRDIGKYLLDKGVSTPPSAWLKSLGVPSTAMPDVQKGNRRAGKRFIPSKVKWLADELVA
jgi:hypothetical protein